MNNFLINKRVQDSIEILIWKCCRASVFDTLTNRISYAVRFNTQRDLTTSDGGGRYYRGFAWTASNNATKDYFKQK
jgi:hypothetical protein